MVLGWCGRRVGGLGPGLTSETATPLGLSCERLAGRAPGFGTHRRCRPDLPGLGKRPGFPDRRPAGACHPSTTERDDHAHRRDTRHHRWRGHPCRCARRGRTGFHRRATRRPGVRGHGAGYADLLDWLDGFGTVCLVGIEGTGSYGAGLARHMAGAGVRVVEVDRSDRQARRRAGKSDPLDAVSAARAAQSGRACGAPKGRDGAVEAIRALMVAKRSGRAERTQTINQARASARCWPCSKNKSAAAWPWLTGPPPGSVSFTRTRSTSWAGSGTPSCANPITPLGWPKTGSATKPRRWPSGTTGGSPHS